MGLVHDRVDVQGQPVPVDTNTLKDIPEELHPDLDRLGKSASELNNTRIEIGRMTQVLQNLVLTCNNLEKNMRDIKSKLIEGMGIEEPGNWAVDFVNKQIGRVQDVQHKTPNIV